MTYGPGSVYKVNIIQADGSVRSVNVLTTEGADDFLNQGHAEFLSQNIRNGIPEMRQELESLRGRNGPSGRIAQLEQQLMQSYVLFECVAEMATDTVFAKLPDSELKALVQHSEQVFSTLTDKKEWKQTGVLRPYDQKLLDALMSNAMHLGFCRVLAQGDLMEILARFIRAVGPKRLPCVDVTETIVGICNNLRVTMTMKHELWSAEQYFKRLDASGLLEQLLRCMTQPVRGGPQPHLQCLDQLMECSEFLRKKLAPGSPLATCLTKLLEGKDGLMPMSRRPPAVMARLQNLHRLTVLRQPLTTNNNETVAVGHMCRNCNKGNLSLEFQKQLLKCSRCKTTYYCSKECQRADWPRHKLTCVPPDKQMKPSITKVSQNVAMSFMEKNYYDIMKEIERVTRDGSVAKRDLIVEIDFYADRSGMAPALRTPAEFKVGPTNGYLKGSRPLEPDWFHKGTHVYKNNIGSVLKGLQEHYERMTDSHILTLARHNDGNTSVYRICLMSQDTGQALFSDEALAAFRKALRDGDDSLLHGIFGPGQVSYIARRRDMDTMGASSSREDLSELAAFINAFRNANLG